MAKSVVQKPEWITADVIDIYSVSNCVSENFANYIQWWKHNGYWFFDTPELIDELAQEHGVDTSNLTWFYYEAYEKQYDELRKIWIDFQPEASFTTNVKPAEEKNLEGYDVVSFWIGTSPECSPLSCNNLAEFVPVNRHCLLETFEDAKTWVEAGRFDDSEPGPYRIFAIYSLPKYRRLSPASPR